MNTVKIKFGESSLYFKGGVKEVTLKNITEIYYNYDQAGRIVFESDTDGEDYIYPMVDIAKFETT